MYLELENLFDFASTIAVLALLAVPYGVALHRKIATPLRNAGLGVFFGVAAMGAMLDPVWLDTGIMFDMRCLPVGLAGGLLGPFGALPAMILAATMRALLGSSGALSGIVGIGIAGSAGIAWFYLSQRMRPVLAFRLVVLSLIVSLHLLSILLLPAEIVATILVGLAPLSVALNIFGALVVGGLFDRERLTAEREQALDEATMTDPLTGIANRRGFERFVEASVARRASAPGSALFVIDLDQFKAINDGYGHDAGDAVLTQVGARLTRCLRGTDVVARFGGEEFVAFLPATPFRSAVAVAERLCSAVSDQAFTVGDRTIPVTVSVGAHWNADFVDPAAAFASADRALYVAKASGRNRVVFDHWLDQQALAA